MKGYFIDSASMNELWARLTEIDLENVNEVRDALGFTKGILYPIKLGDYEEVKPKKRRGAGMTREEIIEGLKLLEDNMVYFDELLNDKGKWIDVHELLFEAIEVLEREFCEDAIDRAEAMTEIMMFAGNVKSDEEDVYIKVSDAVQLLRELPPVNLQEPKADVLDKIRAEIEHLTITKGGEDYVRKMAELYSLKIKVLQIIDKYKAESEGTWTDR